MPRRLPLALLALIPITGSCSDSANQDTSTQGKEAATESPREAALAIAALYEKGEFDELVRTRYAELYKASSEEEVQKLITRFEQRFSRKEKLEEAVRLYRSAAERSPQFTESGAVATIEIDASRLKLSRMENGLWGFHL